MIKKNSRYLGYVVTNLLKPITYFLLHALGKSRFLSLVFVLPPIVCHLEEFTYITKFFFCF